MTEQLDLRQQIEAYLSQEKWAEAGMLLATRWRQQPTQATAIYVISRFERLRAYLPFVSCRLAILRSFTVEPIVPLLRAEAFVNGIDLTVQVSDFNTYAQEILDPNSQFYQFAPELVILAVQTRDVAPEVWERYTDLSASEIKAAVERVSADFRNLVQTFRANSRASLVIHNLEAPAFPGRGVLDNQAAMGQGAAIQQINQELRHLVSTQAGVYILDYDALVARHGRLRWNDARNWFTMRLPIAAEYLIYLAKEWLRFIHPLSGKVCKVLVTDLDNTLWGGVIGEETIETLKVGPEYPGVAYQALQRALLDLYNRGIILAVCSKNNPNEAMHALESHPGMILQPYHFAAFQINWNDKVQNLRQIAAELNLGLDALAFLDDNPVERMRVRSDLPEVSVIELPDNPLNYVQALCDSPFFERLALSEEDQQRGRFYAEQRQRHELENSVASLEDFYRSLQQKLEIAPASAQTFARIAQLTQKTNQFNLTTRRYTEQAVAEMATNPTWRLYSLGVEDRFGDNGLVGVAILHFTGDSCEIDTFLLSCRVIGRTIETAFLAYIVQVAQTYGAKQLRGWFLPTKKNLPAQNFYATHGFEIMEQQEGGTLWSLDLDHSQITYPEWLSINAKSSI